MMTSQEFKILDHKLNTLIDKPKFIIEEFAVAGRRSITGTDGIVYKTLEDSHLIRIIVTLVGGDGAVTPISSNPGSNAYTNLIHESDQFRSLLTSTAVNDYITASDATVLDIPINQKFKQGIELGALFVTAGAVDCSVVLIFRRVVPLARLKKPYRTR